MCSRYLSRDDQQHAVSQIAGLAADTCSLSLLPITTLVVRWNIWSTVGGLIIGYLIDGRGECLRAEEVSKEKADEYEALKTKAFMPIRIDDEDCVD